MNFWKENRRKILRFVVIEFLVAFLLFYLQALHLDHSIIRAIVFASVMTAFMSFLFMIPRINTFRVIRRLINDDSDLSILPLFDDGYRVEMKYKNSRLWFSVPQLIGVISGLPVIVHFDPPSRSSYAYIVFRAIPLEKQNSKRVYSEELRYRVRFSFRLKKDVKPEVLAFIESLKNKGFNSGLGRPLSTKHREQYE